MDATLEAIRTAWDKTEGEGRDEVAARNLADEFVTTNPDLFTSMATMRVEELVTAVENFRASGMEEEEWRIEAWLLHHYEPQNIGGSAQPTVRIS